MKNKILIIGIDGGSWSLLQPAIDGGYMPNLKRIMEQGASGILHSTIPAITPAAWGSFQTGRNPGENGVYDFWRWDNDNKTSSIVNSTSLNNTIWQLATDAGLKVGTLNVPMTYPPKSDSGDIVGGLLTPSLDSNFTWPPELKQKLLKHIPDYDILNLEKAYISPAETDVTTFINLMKKNLNWRYEAAKFMITNSEYDLFMVHYHETDIIQHGLWCFIDPQHPLFNKENQKLVFKDFYGHLDNVIKNTIELSKGNITFLVSDHGFQSHLYEYNMAGWLKRNGYIDDNYIKYKLDCQPKTQKKAFGLVKTLKNLGFGKFIRKFMPETAVEKLELKTNLKNTSNTYKFDCKVHCSTSCRECFIHILDQKHKDEIINDIIAQIGSITDRDGKPVVQNIYRKEDIYSGSKLKYMPDLTIVPIDNWTFCFKPDMADQDIININLNNTFHMGTHHQNGIFISTGEQVKSGAATNHNLTDIAPTVFWLLNLENSQVHFDGEVITDIWKPEFIQSMKDNCISPNKFNINDREESSASFNQEEKSTLEKRLNDLGYM